MADQRLCLGVIVGVHGLRGLLKVKSFTEDPAALASYGPLSDQSGTRAFAVAIKGRAKGTLLVAIDGVTDRRQAEALRGTELFIERSALPDTDEEEVFYHADLVGLAVEDEAGARLGRVTALHNHGAGDLIEIALDDVERGSAPSLMLPFTRTVVPVIDLGGGRVVVARPAETEVKPEPGSKAQDDPKGEDE